MSTTSDGQSYDDLLRIRKEAYPHFDLDQEQAAQTLYRRIKPMLEKGAITHILDCGCGTGEILRHLYCLVSNDDRIDSETVKFIGFDISQDEISAAIKLHKKHKVNSQLFVHDLCQSTLSAELEQIPWSQTIMLLTGHTLPHLSTDEVCSFLMRTRPKFLFVDFYQTWDLCLATLKKKPSTRVVEPKGITSENRTHALSTVIATDDPSYVMRGICTCDGAKWTDTFLTRQYRQGSDAYVKKIKTLGYYIEDRFKYYAGYGKMNGLLFAHKDPLFKQVNAAYHKCVTELARDLFLERTLADSLSLFDGKFLAAIHPFDTNDVYARYVGLGNFPPDKTMRISMPNPQYEKYPSARGLYMSMIAPVSCPTAVPLGRMINVPQSDLDRSLAKEEEDFFQKVCKHCRDNNENVMEQDFFVIPFYFGTLPVFCFICTLLPSLHKTAVHPDMFVALLRNFHDLVQTRIQDRFLPEVMTPFLSSVVSIVKAKSWNEGADAVAHDIIHNGFSRTGREWKSWLTGIASWPIERIDRVRREHERLESHIQSELLRLTSSPYQVISDLVRAVSFFSGEGHEGLVDEIHIPCIERLRKLETSTAQGSIPMAVRDSMAYSWFSKELDVMYNGMINESKSGEPGDAYLKTKEVFNRCYENEGARYRWSTWRLALLISIECEIEVLTTKYAPYSFLYKMPSRSVVVEGDISEELISFVQSVPKKSKVLLISNARKKQISGTLSIILGDRIGWSRAGQDAQRLCQAIERIRARCNQLGTEFSEDNRERNTIDRIDIVFVVKYDGTSRQWSKGVADGTYKWAQTTIKWR